MNNEKKLINLFKNFVERALLPQLKKVDGSQAEWSKFSSMISTENINYNELTLYVDSLSSNVPLLSTLDKQSSHNKKKQNNSDLQFGFNPNKTFGGERNKLNIFSFGEEGEKKEQVRNESVRSKTALLNGNTLNSLEKLLKVLEENQQLIENLGKQNTRDNHKSNNKYPSPSAYYQKNYH